MMTDTKLPGIWGDVIKAGQEGQTGGGVACLVKLESGYKIYAKGFDNSETFFPAPAGETPEILQKRAEIRQQAIKFVEERQAMDNKGRLCNPDFGVQLTAYPDNVVSGGNLTTWKGARMWNFSTWQPFFNDVFIPALIDLGVLDMPLESWALLQWKEDPTGRTESDGQGGTRVKRLPVIAKIYNSMEDAHKENIKEGTGNAPASTSGGNDAFPGGYNEKSWENVKPMIKEACHTLIKEGKTVPEAAGEIAGQWGVDVKYVIPIAAEPPF